eukprot:gene9357-10382_t
MPVPRKEITPRWNKLHSSVKHVESNRHSRKKKRKHTISQSRKQSYYDLYPGHPLLHGDNLCSLTAVQNNVDVDIEDEQHANVTFLVMGGSFIFSLMAIFGIGILDVIFGQSGLNHTLTSFLAVSIGAAVIITYVVGGRAAFSKQWHMFQPLQGGIRFVALQAFSWTLFAISLTLPTFPFILALIVPMIALRGTIMAAGLIAFVSQAVMATSLLTFRKSKQKKPSLNKPAKLSLTRCTSTGKRRAMLPSGNQFSSSKVLPEGVPSMDKESVQVHQQHTISYFLQSASGHRWWRSFIGAQVLLSLTGVGYAVLVDVYSKHEAGPILLFACLVCLTVAIFLTYGIGGQWAYSKQRWSFYQPFVGGIMFITLQMISWTFFATSTFVLVLHICHMLSIFPKHYMYEPLPSITTLWVALGVAYIPTFARTPSVNGRRMLPSLIGSSFVQQLADYFHLRIFKAFNDDLPNNGQFILGYHPHGIFPATCLFMTRTLQWQELFPNLTPAVLTSSIIHYVPLFRDLLQYLGGYEVSRHVFVSALQRHGSVILVPGGQAEMISSRSDTNAITIDTTHRGFVRVALEEAARTNKPTFLIPVYAFNETRTLDNIRSPAFLQRFATKQLKANVIYMPYGQFGLPGYPRSVP